MNLNILGIERLTLFRSVYEQCSILSLISSTESQFSWFGVFETVSEAMHDSVDEKLQNSACRIFDENSIFRKFLFWDVIYWN